MTWPVVQQFNQIPFSLDNSNMMCLNSGVGVRITRYRSDPRSCDFRAILLRREGCEPWANNPVRKRAKKRGPKGLLSSIKEYYIMDARKCKQYKHLESKRLSHAFSGCKKIAGRQAPMRLQSRAPSPRAPSPFPCRPRCPARRLVGELTVRAVGYRAHQLKVRREADSIGPGVRVQLQACRLGHPGNLLAVQNPAGEAPFVSVTR